MKFQLLSLLALCAWVSACGGGAKPNPDAGGGGGAGGGSTANTGVCLDNDGDGVPGTGDCAAEPKTDCNDADPKISPDQLEICNDRDDDCDGEKDEGLPQISYFRDQDGDTFGGEANGQGCAAPPSGHVSTQTDCNDLNPAHKPGATETCDGLDEDCDGNVDDGLVFKDFYVDLDGDGFGASDGIAQNSCLNVVAGRVANNTDCDDTRPQVKPGAAELCNKADDNCDGLTDNGITFLNYYPDADGDGAGDKLAAAENSCSAVAGKVVNNTDCNDANGNIRPGAAEICDSLDNNCNTQVDEGLQFSIYYPDSDGDGYGASTGTPQSACRPVAGKVANSQDCNDANAAIKPGATELCNGVDDNCNGATDDGLSFANYYVDADGDTFGAANGVAQNSCMALAGRVTNNSDCNDGAAAIKPGATEICNGLDDNCVGGVDEGLATSSYWVDSDNDGFGAQGSSPQASCKPVTGRVTNNTDCNDSLASVKPGATEICNGVDDNCVNGIDEGLPTASYYPDLDGDTYGSSSAVAQVSCGPVPNKVANNGDCNDANGAIRPTAPELCNMIDDNCDGLIDNGVTFQNYYVDADGDGFGLLGGTPISSCSVVAGRVTNSTDCNDSNAAIRPNATEVCNGVDDNCVGGIDEGLTFLSYYPDLDSDGFGATGSTAQSACAPVPGKVTSNTDCNDSNANIRPNATEVCNGVDDDCVGGIDNGLLFTNYYPDVDGDTYGAATPVTSACSPPSGKVTNSSDCNDANANIKPGATEICNNADDNCNGLIDEGVASGGACTTGQAGVCSAGTLTCQSGAVTCVRTTNPSAEKCDALDNNCNNQVDEDFPNKGAACSVGLGVCVRTGTFVCDAAQTGTQCSATPGNPTGAACDGSDNDCDGVVDEPAFTNTVTMQSTAWTDIEVAPYYYTATGCQGGVAGTGSDDLIGGAAVMAGGTSGLMFQQLSPAGAPVGTPRSIAGLTYSDVAIAQAGDGFIVAGLWLSGTDSVEIDFYYVDSTGTERAREWSEFRRTGTNVLDGLRLVRGNGKRVTAVWRESGVGIKTARVEPFFNATTATWSVLTPTQGVAPFPATTVVANAAVMAGIGADSTHIDWFAQVNCATVATLRVQAVAYIAPVGTTDHSVRYFTMNEDGTSKGPDVTIQTRANSSYLLGEAEVAHYRLGSSLHWLVAFTESGLSPANEDLRYFLSSTYDGGTLPYNYAYLSFATANGSDSIARPRATATGTAAYLSAIRYDVADAGTATKQVMTRKIILATNQKDPSSSTVERSATTPNCYPSETDCRAGGKEALTNFAGWSTGVKVYYSNIGTSAGANASTLTCQ